jgi:hypothetical protein
MEWTSDESKQLQTDEGPLESKIVVSHRRAQFEPPLIAFIPANRTGLHQWYFRQADPDFFPSIPHGHRRNQVKVKLDAYRGWIYNEDRQIGREPRWNIIALWNDKRFRSFASIAIHYYLATYPGFLWRVSHPLKLPRQRGPV